MYNAPVFEEGIYIVCFKQIYYCFCFISNRSWIEKPNSADLQEMAVMPEVGTVPLAPEDVAQQYEKQQRRVRLIASAQEQLQAKEESGGEEAPSTTTKSGFRSLLGKLGLVRRTSSATSSTTSSNNNNAVKQANSSNDNVVSNEIKRKLSMFYGSTIN